MAGPKLTSDWHIHSQSSCDSACITVRDLIDGAAAKGITDFGLTDHLHTPYNLPDIVASRAEYDASRPPPQFRFGIEVSCVSAWEIAEIATGAYDDPVYGLRSGGPAGGDMAIGLTDEDVSEHGIEFVVAGTHWPLYVEMEPEALIRDYHRQNMFLATHPLVDVVAHPWWWMGHWKDDDGQYTTYPWLDDFGRVPESMHDEFAAACIENDTAAEINLSAMLLNKKYPGRFRERYVEYLAGLASRGVNMTIGSDCHSATYDIDFDSAARMLEKAGVTDEHIGSPVQEA
jgi:histidinol phosphatase-like PHP family hydrolase